MTKQNKFDIGEFTEIVSQMDIDELHVILDYACVVIACHKIGALPLKVKLWEKMPATHRATFGEFARAWLTLNGYRQKENALSGQQPTESGEDGLTANLQS